MSAYTSANPGEVKHDGIVIARWRYMRWVPTKWATPLEAGVIQGAGPWAADRLAEKLEERFGAADSRRPETNKGDGA